MIITRAVDISSQAVSPVFIQTSRYAGAPDPNGCGPNATGAVGARSAPRRDRQGRGWGAPGPATTRKVATGWRPGLSGAIRLRGFPGRALRRDRPDQEPDAEAHQQPRP